MLKIILTAIIFHCFPITGQNIKATCLRLPPQNMCYVHTWNGEPRHQHTKYPNGISIWGETSSPCRVFCLVAEGSTKRRDFEHAERILEKLF